MGLWPEGHWEHTELWEDYITPPKPPAQGLSNLPHVRFPETHTLTPPLPHPRQPLPLRKPEATGKDQEEELGYWASGLMTGRS